MRKVCTNLMSLVVALLAALTYGSVLYLLPGEQEWLQEIHKTCGVLLFFLVPLLAVLDQEVKNRRHSPLSYFAVEAGKMKGGDTPDR